MENINKKKLLDAVRKAGFSQDVGEALQKKDLSGVMSSLSGEQAARINEILSDKEALSRLLSSSEAKNIIRALKDDGKR